MSQVNVNPWVGKKYKSPSIFKYKTLILGESNYTNDPSQFNKDMVYNCIQDDLTGGDPGGFCRFSTKIRRIIFGRESTIEPKEFWDNAAFYNFVQFLVGSEARQRPAPDQWKNSIPAFEEIVSELKPDRVLVLGLANWKNLTFYIENEKTSDHTAILNVCNYSVVAGYINHPSSSIRYATWQPIAQSLLLQ